MNATVYPHIEIRDGMPFIENTRIKVVHIVLSRMAHNWDADEIRRQYPSLTLAQIYSALAFYHDNQAEMDRIIEKRLAQEEKLIAEQGMTPIRAKLLAAKYNRLAQ